MCNHPASQRSDSVFEALIPVEGEAMREGADVYRVRAVACECGDVIVSDKVLPLTIDHPAPDTCKCGRPLTQPYAKKLGKCVSCRLAEIRRGRNEHVYLVSNVARERDRKRVQRAGAKA